MEKTLRPEGETRGVVLAVGYIRCSGDGVEAEAANVDSRKPTIDPPTWHTLPPPFTLGPVRVMGR